MIGMTSRWRVWLPDRLAGQYAAAAVIGRGILWLPEIVSFVLFPALASAVVTGVSVRAEMRRSRITHSGSVCGRSTRPVGRRADHLRPVVRSQYPRAAGYAWKIAARFVPTAAANLFMFPRRSPAGTRRGS